MKTFLDLLKYPDVIKGIARGLCGLYSALWIWRLASADDDSLLLRIFLILICVFCCVYLFILAYGDIKTGIRRRDLYESMQRYYSEEP